MFHSLYYRHIVNNVNRYEDILSKFDLYAYLLYSVKQKQKRCCAAVTKMEVKRLVFCQRFQTFVQNSPGMLLISRRCRVLSSRYVNAQNSLLRVRDNLTTIHEET